MTNPFINLTYAESLALIARQYGDQTALVFRDQRYSFADLKDQADTMSKRFHDLGLRSGDKVAILMPNRPEFLFAWLGAAQMGMVAVMINTRLRGEEIAYQLAQSESDAVLIPGHGAFRDFVAEIADLAPAVRDGNPGQLASEKLPHLRWVILLDTPPDGFSGVTDWSGPAPDDLPMPAIETDINQPGIIAYSSGTTALPKGAMIGHQVWRKGWDIGIRVDFHQDDCLYMAIPLFGSMATMNGVLPFWTRGAKVVLGEQFDAATCLQAIETEKVTSMHLLPPIIRQLAEHPDLKTYDTSSFRVGFVLSIAPEILDMVADVLKVPGVMTGYGMTETTTVLTRNRWDDPREVRHATQGYALPDIDLKIVDPETLQELPPNQLGEIWSYGYCNMLGYYKKPEETARVLRPDGWLRTGDVGRLDETGRLTFTGRLGDGYKSRGFNVAPEEIEHILARIKGVSQCAVVGVPDGTDDNIGVAYVIAQDGSEVTDSEILDQLRPQLASYKMPQVVFLVDDLPLTSGTGKVQKFKLRKDALARLNL
ncbi:AMP-binding protein [Rhodobacteraceae bacterium KMM 6894]|nr:AMP-binding protein [Rhodobacteraceae bacterium KMM 6894]